MEIINTKFSKLFKAYVLKDPRDGSIKYIGITIRTLHERLLGHLNDAKNRPYLNYNKTNWIKDLKFNNLTPIIEQIEEFDTIEEMKQFEINYIKENKSKYNLFNLTIGGDHLGFRSHSRESILKKKTTKSIVQYNILGEKLREFEMIEDASKFLNLKEKSSSHITQCCKRKRTNAYGYIWRYKGDELGDISDIDPYSILFNIIEKYDLENNKLKEFSNYVEASKDIDDKSKGSNIKSVIKGQMKSCKGFIYKLKPNFEYINEDLLHFKYEEYKFYINKNIQNVIGTKICQYDLNDNLINTFNSISEASFKVFGTYGRKKSITKCCNKEIDTYENFKWCYLSPRSSINSSNSENELIESTQS